MIDFSTLDARDYSLLAAALVGVYLLVSLLRLLQMRWKRRHAVAPIHSEGGLPGTPDVVAKPGPYRELRREEPRSVPSAGSSPALVEAKDSASAPDFARELARSSLELEVQRLRRDADQLRAEMTHLTEEVRYLKAARNVSPQYSEAITLAQQGVPATGIADRCGISVGEAELVAALARGETGLEYHQNSNDRDNRSTNSGN